MVATSNTPVVLSRAPQALYILVMAFRIICRLDVKPPMLVKGIHLEGLRKVGEPKEFARSYYEQGADEINYHDIVASLYQRNSIGHLLRATAGEVFIPITVGGGIRSLKDATGLLRLGADKICINTAAIRNPSLIRDVADVTGRQAVVLGVEAKKRDSGWEAMTDCGRERTGRDVLDWIAEAESLGAGEVLLTSVDQEGTSQGFDFELIRAARSVCNVPLIAHGGAGDPMDIVGAHSSGADAAAVATALHYNRYSVSDFKDALRDHGVEVRS